MLKDYGKLLLEEHRNGKLFCIVVACIEEGKLQIQREDYGEWERNRRIGTVECDYYLNESNTDKLCKLLKVNTSVRLINTIAKICKSSSGIAYTGNFRSLCEDNDIEYDYRVWY